MPLPEDGPLEAGEPFDIKTQMQIELDLVSVKSDGPVGAVATIATSVGPSQPAPATSALGETAFGLGVTFHISPGGKDHYWYAYCNRKLRATVTPQGGAGTMQGPPNPPVNVNVNYPRIMTAREVIVHSANGMDYLFGGSFNSHHGKNC